MNDERPTKNDPHHGAFVNCCECRFWTANVRDDGDPIANEARRLRLCCTTIAGTYNPVVGVGCDCGEESAAGRAARLARMTGSPPKAGTTDQIPVASADEYQPPVRLRQGPDLCPLLDPSDEALRSRWEAAVKMGTPLRLPRDIITPAPFGVGRAERYRCPAQWWGKTSRECRVLTRGPSFKVYRNETADPKGAIGYDEWCESVLPFVAGHGEDADDDRQPGGGALGTLAADPARLNAERLDLLVRLFREYGRDYDPKRYSWNDRLDRSAVRAWDLHLWRRDAADRDIDALDNALLDAALRLDPIVRREDEARFVAGKVKEHKRRAWLMRNRRAVHLNTVPTDDSYLDEESYAERRMRLAVLSPRRRWPIPSESFEFRPDPSGQRETHGVRVSCASVAEFNPPAWAASRGRGRPVVHNGPGGRFGSTQSRRTMPITFNRAAVFLSLARNFDDPLPEFADGRCVAVGIAPLRKAGPVGAVVESPFDDYSAIFNADDGPSNMAAVMTRVCPPCVRRIGDGPTQLDPGWPTSPADRAADIVFKVCPDLVHAGRVGRPPIPRQPIRRDLARLLEGATDPAAVWGVLNSSERLHFTVASACRSPLAGIIQRSELIRQRDGRPSAEHPLHEFLRERLVGIGLACVRVYQGLAALGEALRHKTLHGKRWRDAWRQHGSNLLLHLDGAASRVENWNPDDLRHAVADGRAVPTGRGHNAVERLAWWIDAVNGAAMDDRAVEFQRRGPRLDELVEVGRGLQAGGVEATIAAYAATQAAEVLWRTIARKFEQRARAVDVAINGIGGCHKATNDAQDWHLSVVLRVMSIHARSERDDWRTSLDGGIWPGRDEDVEDVVARVVLQTVPVPSMEEDADDAEADDDEQTRVARWRTRWAAKRAKAVLRRTRDHHVKRLGAAAVVQYPDGQAAYTARNRCARLIPDSVRRLLDAIVEAYVDPTARTTRKDR